MFNKGVVFTYLTDRRRRDALAIFLLDLLNVIIDVLVCLVPVIDCY